MKLIRAILSIWMLCMFTMPCNDAVAQEAISYISTDIDHDEDSHEDFCSPFCVCQCCGTIVTSTDIIFYSYTFKYTSFNTHLFSYKNEYFMNVNNSVWHPPTLS